MEMNSNTDDCKLFNIMINQEPDKMFETFEMNMRLFSKSHIILFGEKGYALPFAWFPKTEKFELVTLSDKRHILFLNKDTVEKMKRFFTATYHIKPIVLFDVQALSYLRALYKGHNNESVLKIKSAVEYICDNKMCFDPVMYIFENAKKLRDIKTYETVYDNLIAYECLRQYEKKILTFESDEYRNDSNVIIGADYLFTGMQRIGAKWDDLEAYIPNRMIYALLLKAVLVQWTKNSVKQKITAVLNFSYNELGILFEREVAICYALFQNRLPKFFKRIKKGNKTILADIYGMAWDITHLWTAELVMAFNIDLCADVEIPCILSFDKGMQEVIAEYPLKAVGMHKGIKYRSFAKKLSDVIKEVDITKFIIPMEERNPQDVEKLIFQLEKDVCKQAFLA